MKYSIAAGLLAAALLVIAQQHSQMRAIPHPQPQRRIQRQIVTPSTFATLHEEQNCMGKVAWRNAPGYVNR